MGSLKWLIAPLFQEPQRSGSLFHLFTGLPVAALLLSVSGCSSASNNASSSLKLDRQLNEQIVMLPVQIEGKTVELETTLYKPSGNGPFPLLLMNHGKNPGNARTQPRSRHLEIASVFVHRGFAVAIPMREGFAASGGDYPKDGCDVRRHAFDEADGVAAALKELVKLPYVDRSRIVIAGQSDGGLVTMALSTHPLPGVLGAINFSGGLRQPKCEGWQQNLVRTYGAIGKQARYPSVWFYGDNDQLWPQPMPEQMFNAYTRNAEGDAGHARMIDIGTFGKNSHDFADSKAGVKLWYPQVKAFVQSLGMPFEPLSK
ncbi:prolyl oligopeptidase family serine peptidase [Enterobacter sp. Ap-916]|uniref:dienelactone hydrolase family protein n=1 Tax=unclassified Enterobacter TaxID=2608935 RepID=UPI00141FEA99|nr:MULTISPECIES: prolyl oligopeptidase family serine peptidase [unclassified Enterobacter]NIF57976.1 prolyl oligopeptidase family serine peptidase [Enterobacter sp. Ap-867]NIG28082.1 prolyl oligopeptidase family serine peptidase [Enterobacter sp. Ap-916]